MKKLSETTQKRVGSPGGYRWNWFLLGLSYPVKNNYIIDAFNGNSYYLKRKTRKRDPDTFQISRTSPKCWRCMRYDGTQIAYTSFTSVFELQSYILCEVLKALEKEE